MTKKSKIINHYYIKLNQRKGNKSLHSEQPEVKHEQIEVEQTTSNKEEKIEQLKREFGVYEALAEVEREKAIAIEWTQSYRKQEQVEQHLYKRHKNNSLYKRHENNSLCKLNSESSSEKVVQKKKEKEKTRICR